MKKIIALVVALIMTMACFTACGSTNKGDDKKGDDGDKKKIKIGVILIGDENEGYTYAHIEGIKKAITDTGFDANNVIWKYSVPEDEKCYDTAIDLVDQGCTAIFSNSYGHQAHMERAARENSNVTFVSMTGDTAKSSGLSNFCNAFNSVYESRYVSGVVAGMKVAELVKNNKLTDKNYTSDKKVKIGYVGAYPYAEVVSGYTAFFLGIQSVYKDVAMQVTYTNSWFSPTDESAAGSALAADGCVIIGQHADSTGAPSAIQALHDKGQEVYSVGYNIDMLSVAKTAALTSATNNWAVYYTYAFNQLIKGEKIATNWAEGYKTGAVAITTLGGSCAEGTDAKVKEVESALKAGTLNVFDTSKFTVGGKNLTEYKADVVPDAKFEHETNVIENGVFYESKADEFRSAPYFDVRIDGITELNSK